MAGEKHTIGRCVFELGFTSEKTAFALQKELPGCLGQDFYDSLDQILNKYLTNGETILIDRIEVDLGSIARARFTEELPWRLLNGLDAGIRKQFDLDYDAFTVTEKHTGNKDMRMRKMDKHESLMRILCFFLNHGILPWWADQYDLQELEHQILAPEFSGYEQLKSGLLNLHDKKRAAGRLARQFSPEFNSRLLKILFSLDLEDIDPGTRHPVHDSGKFQATTRQSQILSTIWALILRGDYSDHIHLRNKIMAEVTTITGQSEPPDQDPADPLEYHDIEKETTLGDDRRNDASQQNINQQSPVSDNGNVVFIGNSGLVILWPYLELFFEKLGLAGNGHFIDRHHHERALLISQFLATGLMEFRESEMMLNKIITGWPVEETFHNIPIINEEEKLACEDLLRAVIGHWTMLKNTTPDGLRESFLLRTGRLSLRGDGWLLQVEKKGFDILLEQLPWSISAVRLSWMKNILITEW